MASHIFQDDAGMAFEAEANISCSEEAHAGESDIICITFG